MRWLSPRDTEREGARQAPVDSGYSPQRRGGRWYYQARWWAALARPARKRRGLSEAGLGRLFIEQPRDGSRHLDALDDQRLTQCLDLAGEAGGVVLAAL